MAKEKPADPEKEARRAAKAEKKAAKSSETNGVHKSKSDKKDKKEKREKKEKVEKREEKEEKVKAEAKEEKIAAEAEDTQVTTKLLNKLEDTKPGSVVVKDDTGDLKIKVKNASIKGALVPFAVPLADEKAGKKVLKSVKKAAKNKSLKRGVKEVVKALRKSPLASASGGEALAVVVLAADISPMDVLSHIPVLCEDHGAPYIFVTSRAELGAASATKRPTSVVMVSKEATGKNKKSDDEGEDFSETYNDLVKIVVKAGRDVKI